MLDVDYFKQYNDTYGHLMGDSILKILCTSIRHHIKQLDAVGRWGGEEFAISLPEASGAEALRVAERIRQTMASLQVEDRYQKMIPVPTVSQGIAVYPQEADEIYRLVDLAVHRLYIAKSRGRNQVEPSPVQDEVIYCSFAFLWFMRNFWRFSSRSWPYLGFTQLLNHQIWRFRKIGESTVI
jgi:diguanylate cyclase (GGDEF)-like protein